MYIDLMVVPFALRPGGNVVQRHGGVHRLASENRDVLTSSGGLRIVSLSKLSSVSEEDVSFQSSVDSIEILLTPERIIEIRNQIGAEIITALDDTVASTTTGSTVEETVH